MGVIAMKVYSQGTLLGRSGLRTDEALGYALSLPGVSTVIVGCSTPEEVEQNARIARDFATFGTDTMRELEKRTARSEAIHDALFRAYFVDGLNIALADTLVGVAEQAGLPKDEAREVLDSRRFKDAVDADWQRSSEIGVTGVPTFVVGDRAVVGAQPYEALEKLVVEAGAELRH